MEKLLRQAKRHAESALPPGLNCQECGCHDGSVRLVSYPFVYGPLVAIPGEYKGRWCRRHQLRYLLQAALITATAGFLGIGIFFSAWVALIQLAKGGKLHKANNTRQLRSMADYNQERGDRLAALSCLEASFHFTEDVWGQEALNSEYQRLQAEPRRQPAGWKRSLPLMALLLGAAGLGWLVGGLDFFLSDYLPWKFFKAPPPLATFYWLTLFALGLPAAVLLRYLFEGQLEKLRFRQPYPPMGLAVGLTLLFGAGILQGRVLGNFIEILRGNATLPPQAELLRIAGAVITRGPLLEIYRAVHEPVTIHGLRGILWLIVIAYALFAFLHAAVQSARWNKRLAKIPARSPLQPAASPATGWAALGLLPVVIPLLIASFPQQALVDFLQARDHYEAGWNLYGEDQQKALNEFQAAVALDPYMAEAYEDLAWTYAEMNQPEEAIRQYLRSIEINPKRASAHYYLGDTYYFESQYDLAVQEFETAARLDENMTAAYLGLGWAAYMAGDLEKAEQGFLKVIQVEPDWYDAYEGLGYVYEDSGDSAHQIETLEKAAKTADAPSEAYVLLGMAYFNDYELEKAAESLSLALQINRQSRYAQAYLAISYLRIGQVDAMLESSLKSVEREPDWSAPHALLAMAYMQMHRPEEAAAEAQAALDLGAETDMDRMLLLEALTAVKWYEAAETEAWEGVHHGFRPADFYLYLANLASAQEKYAEAFEFCDQAAEADAEPADVLEQRASIYYQQDELEKSLELLQQAQAEDPESPSIHAALSLVSLDLEQYDQARSEAQAALAINRYDQGAYFSLAFAQLELGDAPGALKSAKRAGELGPYDALPHFIAGVCSYTLHEPAAALGSLNRFMELAEGDEDLAELRQQAEQILEKVKNPGKESS